MLVNPTQQSFTSQLYSYKISLSCILIFLTLSLNSIYAQEDGYLSERGTNGSFLIKQNKITKETVYNYAFQKNTSNISIFSDLSKIILTDSVTIYFDENGNMSKRIRSIKKNNATLIDTFYYNNNNQLTQISSSSFCKGQENNLGYTIFTYNIFGKVESSNTAYILQNGLIKNSEVKKVYNDNGQLIEIWHKSNLSSLVLTEKYFYNRRGRVKRIENYNYDYKTSFHYRHRWTKISSTNYNEYYHRTDLLYNKRHQCIKKEHGDRTDEFRYNTDGTLAESKAHYYDNMYSISQHIYTKE